MEDIGDLSRRRSVTDTQIQVGGRRSEPPDVPAALQVRGELAPVRIPSSIFNASFARKTFAVHGSPRHPIPGEQPGAVRGHALPFRRTDWHRWTDGTSCNEASEITRSAGL